MTDMSVHFSDDTDEWATPPDLLRPLDRAVGGFDLDPCSGAEERSIAPETYSEEDDGLARPWFGSVWCNPPYSAADDWADKARGEASRDEVDTVVLLLASRTSTAWFQDRTAEGDRVCFIRGRLRFGDAEDDAPFPSLLIVFGDVPEALDRVLRVKGVTFRPGDRLGSTQEALAAFEEADA